MYGSIVLPNGIGKSKVVLVFAQGDDAAAAEKAGADFVGGKDLAEKIKGGWTEFDAAIATPDMMGLVRASRSRSWSSRIDALSRAGTVTTDVAADSAGIQGG